ncbi:MAG: cell division protein FtsL [Treponema sp.]|jgi:cell division protein FtsL|nr:cell division protein FtsL [Treponema sp.]
MKKYIFFYFAVITIPLFLGLLVWQSNKYLTLSREIKRLEQAQTEWVESNKRLVAAIAENSSQERIENIILRDSRLQKIRPENVLQIKITEAR